MAPTIEAEDTGGECMGSWQGRQREPNTDAQGTD